MLLLVPILYIVPLGFNAKGKLIIIGVSFLLATVGLIANMYYELWQTLIMLFGLALIVTYFTEKKLRNIMIYSDHTNDNKDADHSYINPDAMEHKQEQIHIESNVKNNEDYSNSEHVNDMPVLNSIDETKGQSLINETVSIDSKVPVFSEDTIVNNDKGHDEKVTGPLFDNTHSTEDEVQAIYLDEMNSTIMGNQNDVVNGVNHSEQFLTNESVHEDSDSESQIDSESNQGEKLLETISSDEESIIEATEEVVDEKHETQSLDLVEVENRSELEIQDDTLSIEGLQENQVYEVEVLHSDGNSDQHELENNAVLESVEEQSLNQEQQVQAEEIEAVIEIDVKHKEFIAESTEYGLSHSLHHNHKEELVETEDYEESSIFVQEDQETEIIDTKDNEETTQGIGVSDEYAFLTDQNVDTVEKSLLSQESIYEEIEEEVVETVNSEYDRNMQFEESNVVGADDESETLDPLEEELPEIMNFEDDESLRDEQLIDTDSIEIHINESDLELIDDSDSDGFVELDENTLDGKTEQHNLNNSILKELSHSAEEKMNQADSSEICGAAEVEHQLLQPQSLQYSRSEHDEIYEQNNTDEIETNVEETINNVQISDDKLEETVDEETDQSLENDMQTVQHHELEPIVEQQDKMDSSDSIKAEHVESTETLNEHKPKNVTKTKLQQQMFHTMVSQIHLSRTLMSGAEYEQMILGHLHPDLPQQDYYTFAHLLIEHYIEEEKYHLLSKLLTDLIDRFDNYPILMEEILFLYDKYCQDIM